MEREEIYRLTEVVGPCIMDLQVNLSVHSQGKQEPRVLREALDLQEQPVHVAGIHTVRRRT